MPFKHFVCKEEAEEHFMIVSLLYWFSVKIPLPAYPYVNILLLEAECIKKCILRVNSFLTVPGGKRVRCFNVVLCNRILCSDGNVLYSHCAICWPLATCGYWTCEIQLLQLRNWIILCNLNCGQWLSYWTIQLW